jgi:hypothetical protein
MASVPQLALVIISHTGRPVVELSTVQGEEYFFGVRAARAFGTLACLV